jgi:hypothetical protein
MAHALIVGVRDAEQAGGVDHQRNPRLPDTHFSVPALMSGIIRNPTYLHLLAFSQQSPPDRTSMKKPQLFLLTFALIHCLLANTPLDAGTPALTVMARSGSSNVVSIDPNIAINREGVIAFTGTDSTGSRVFVVSSPEKPMPIVPAVAGRTYAGVGITSGPNPGVVYRDFVPGFPIGFILRESFVPGPLTVTLGSSVSVSGPADWDSITSNSIDVSSNGTAVVSGLVNGSTSTALFIGNTRPLTQAFIVPGAFGWRPEISDSGEAVIRDNTGRIITLAAIGPERVVAGTSNGFDLMTTGNRPGISTNGSAIAFSGKKSGDTAAGIYAVVTPNGNVPILVAGAAEGFTGFTSEQRIGVRAIHSTVASGGSTDLFTVVFQGSKNGVSGIYSRDITATNGVLQPLGPITELLKVGDALAGATVMDFALYHPINDDGLIACTVNLSGGSVAILKISPSLAGVHASLSRPTTSWANTEYDNDGIRFFVQDAWDGHQKFGTTGPINYNAIKASKIGAAMTAMIGAYAVISLDNGPTEIPGAVPGITDQTGFLQITEAFKVFPVATFPLAFMAIDAEVKDLSAPRLSQNNAVARYADAIWAVWTNGVPTFVYTNKAFWNALTGNSKEIQGVHLWDADPNTIPTQSLGGFTLFGAWTQRLGRQWTPPPGVNLGNPPFLVDRDVFDPALFALPQPPVGCKPALFVSDLSLSRLGTELVLSGTLSNDARAYSAGTSFPPVCDALAARINEATLLIPGQPVISSGYSMDNPLKLKTIRASNGPPFPPGTPFTIVFSPSASIASGTLVAVHLSLSCGGLKVPARSYHLFVP